MYSTTQQWSGMPFERYFQDHEEPQQGLRGQGFDLGFGLGLGGHNGASSSYPSFDTIYDGHRNVYDNDDDMNSHGNNYNNSSGSINWASQMTTPTPTHPHSHPHPLHASPAPHSTLSHPVRLQIPSYMQPGMNLPTLAPGGGAEVLPAGLWSSAGPSRAGSASTSAGEGSKASASACASAQSGWYTNNGLIPTTFDAELTSFQKLSKPLNQPNPETNVEKSPFDYSDYTDYTEYDYDHHSSPESQKPPTMTTPTLSQHISSGRINPQHSLTSAQLDAIGLGNMGVASPLPSGSLPYSQLTLSSPSHNTSSPSLPLPIYSRSGFDLLSILAYIASRPNPQISLGPVDMSSSFVVVDVRRYDQPIIYCSPNFCTLTGYAEEEVLGRNCRFLQDPGGKQEKGEWRRWTSNDAVGYFKKCLSGDDPSAEEGKDKKDRAGGKECQTSIINYRKGGEAFINLVTVIPIRNDVTDDEKVVYHVGFQVDLGEQPKEILKKLKDGSYMRNYGANVAVPRSGQQQSSYSTSGGAGATASSSSSSMLLGPRKTHPSNSILPPVLSRELKIMIEDPRFMRRYPIDALTLSQSHLDSHANTSTTSIPNELVPAQTQNQNQNHPLSLLLLSYIPDFIHVVSLKGTFLYVSPSVKRVLGWDAEDLVGGSSSSSHSLGLGLGPGRGESGSGDNGGPFGLADICHPADIVPLMRELKESSATGGLTQGDFSTGAGGGGGGGEESYKPRPVDLLFRARVKPQSENQLSSSSSPSSSPYSSSSNSQHGPSPPPKYVWIECRGRLHVEPGKGRKAIILCGRAKEMMNLTWGGVQCAGGVSAPVSVKKCKDVREDEIKAKIKTESPSTFTFPSLVSTSTISSAAPTNSTLAATSTSTISEITLEDSQTEFWGTITRSSASLLVVGKGVKDVLGWDPGELIGKQVFRLIVDDEIDVGETRMRMRQKVHDELRSMGCTMVGGRGKGEAGELPRRIGCRMFGRSSSVASSVSSISGFASGSTNSNSNGLGEGTIPINVELILYPSAVDSEILNSKQTISPAPIIYQIKLAAFSPSSDQSLSSSSSTKSNTSSLSHPLLESLFKELEIGRKSSWQYELQQLKYQNERLKEEIRRLEEVEREMEMEKERGRHKKEKERQREVVVPGQARAQSQSTTMNLMQKQQQQGQMQVAREERMSSDVMAALPASVQQVQTIQERRRLANAKSQAQAQSQMDGMQQQQQARHSPSPSSSSSLSPQLQPLHDQALNSIQNSHLAVYDHHLPRHQGLGSGSGSTSSSSYMNMNVHTPLTTMMYNSHQSQHSHPQPRPQSQNQHHAQSQHQHQPQLLSMPMAMSMSMPFVVSSPTQAQAEAQVQNQPRTSTGMVIGAAGASQTCFPHSHQGAYTNVNVNANANANASMPVSMPSSSLKRRWGMFDHSQTHRSQGNLE